MADDVVEAADTADNGKCHLLALPAELRNEIWKLVLPKDKKFCACQRKWRYICQTNRPYRPPELFGVCRQIEWEAGSLWYPSLQIHSITSSSVHWMEMLSGQKAALIRDFEICDDLKSWYEAEKKLYYNLLQLQCQKRLPSPGALKFHFPLVLEDGKEVKMLSKNPRKDAWENGVDIRKFSLSEM